jgi:hypothetical protein
MLSLSWAPRQPDGPLRLTLNILLHKFIYKQKIHSRTFAAWLHYTHVTSTGCRDRAATDSGTVHSELSPAGRSHGGGTPPTPPPRLASPRPLRDLLTLPRRLPRAPRLQWCSSRRSASGSCRNARATPWCAALCKCSWRPTSSPRSTHAVPKPDA